jgi:ABC-type Fe3+/spermidine/putrescine transport system ATPase subunit|tara:strand:- start:6708 stop:7679 length:972 start_codon:yes stop_codon:yes gene_type:complete
LIELRNISKAYRQTKVLVNVTGTIKKGSLVAIVGMSGSGKTTLLKIIAGLLEPDLGTIYFQNKKLEGPKSKLVPGHEEINLVFQDFALKLNMSVEENLNYALLGYQEDYKKKRVDDLIALCGLEELRKHQPQELSGGQKQRVAFSRALASEPAVILMDEPFSNLDPLTKQSLLIETKALAKITNTTIILVTHDTRDAMEIADEIWVLQDGIIIQKGRPKEIHQKPASAAVGRLFGIINLLNVAQSQRLFQINQATGIWMGDVYISKTGPIQGLIKDVIFYGTSHKLIIEIEEGLQLIALDVQKELKKGHRIQLSVATDKIILF